jgi:hypothetical protein
VLHDDAGERLWGTMLATYCVYLELFSRTSHKSSYRDSSHSHISTMSIERQPATISSSNRTPTDRHPIPLRTFYTRQATTRTVGHGTVPPKRHVVQQRQPQEQQIVYQCHSAELDGTEVNDDLLFLGVPLLDDVTLGRDCSMPNCPSSSLAGVECT